MAGFCKRFGLCQRSLSEVVPAQESIRRPLSNLAPHRNVSLSKLLREGSLEERQGLVKLALTPQDFCFEDAKSRSPFDVSGGFACTKRTYVGTCPNQISALYFRPGIGIKSLGI